MGWFRRSAAVIGLATMVSCASKSGDQSGLWRRIVRNGDKLYVARQDLRSLDQAIQWYLSGDREFPGQPTILGKLSLAYAARA